MIIPGRTSFIGLKSAFIFSLIYLQFGCTGLCTIPDLCKEIDPDGRDNDRALVEMHIQRIRGYAQDHLPHLDYRQPAIVETCIYTVGVFIWLSPCQRIGRL